LSTASFLTVQYFIFDLFTCAVHSWRPSYLSSTEGCVVSSTT
jgi:hypothetical protein